MDYIIEELKRNKGVFKELLQNCPKEMQLWRPAPEKWCLLEIICHLYDEERLDFRFRTKWVLERPNETPPPIDPVQWLNDHQYMQQDFDEMLSKFLDERTTSIQWLEGLEDPKWDNSFEHSKFGVMTAAYFFRNWLAHDFLHIRQITKTKFQYLNSPSKSDLNYAGTW